jgi:hypothetical protein
MEVGKDCLGKWRYVFKLGLMIGRGKNCAKYAEMAKTFKPMGHIRLLHTQKKMFLLQRNETTDLLTRFIAAFIPARRVGGIAHRGHHAQALCKSSQWQHIN